MNGISALLRDPRGLPHPLRPVRAQRGQPCMNPEGALTRADSAGTLTLAFQSPGLWEMSPVVCRVLLQLPGQTVGTVPLWGCP